VLAAAVAVWCEAIVELGTDERKEWDGGRRGGCDIL